MKIYDAITLELIESPNLSAGYLVDGTIVTGYASEVIENTVTEYRPEGIRHRVPVTEPCQWYFPNPGKPEEQPSASNFEDRLSAVENGVEDAKEGLAAAKILLGVE